MKTKRRTAKQYFLFADVRTLDQVVVVFFTVGYLAPSGAHSTVLYLINCLQYHFISEETETEYVLQLSVTLALFYLQNRNSIISIQ